MKLTRKASVLLFVVAIFIVGIIGYRLIPKEEKNVQSYFYEMLLENANINGYGKIVLDHPSDKYVKYDITIKNAGGYQLSQPQIFTKYIQFNTPKNISIGEEKATNYAYSFVLKGDIVRIINQTTKEKQIRVENASIEYAAIPIRFNDKQDTVYYTKNGQVKDMTFTRFKKIISDPLMRDNVIDKE